VRIKKDEARIGLSAKESSAVSLRRGPAPHFHASSWSAH
jgi:hypothetical protein